MIKLQALAHEHKGLCDGVKAVKALTGHYTIKRISAT